MKKSFFSLALVFLLSLFFIPKSFAFNEVCPTSSPCCVPPQAIVDGGGCPSGQYWIGNPLTGSCQAPTACLGVDKFQCATNTCDDGGNTCSTTAVETTICCADGQVAIRDDAALTGWSCAANGSSPWSSDAFGPYVFNKQVGIGQSTAATSYSLAVKADGNNAATAGAITADATLANSVGIQASGTRAGGVFTALGGAALEAVSQGAIRVLSDSVEGVGTVVGFFQSVAGGTNEVRLGSSSNHNVSFLRNSVSFMKLVDSSGIRQYVNFPTGTEAAPTSFESGYVLIGDPSGVHVAIDGDEIQAKATSTTPNTLQLNTGSTGNVEINLLQNSYTLGVCRSGEILGQCSSLRKYKKDIFDLPLGLKEVLQLRPVQFKWKDEKVINGRMDLGFIAEEASEVNSIFGEYDSQGALSGVRYAQLTSLLTKAVQEVYGLIQGQQKQLDEQKIQLEKQQTQIEQLQSILCLDHPESEFCAS